MTDATPPLTPEQLPPPNPSPWWKATLAATFLWLCGGYLLGGQCGGMDLIGPCKLVMHASPLLGYAAIAWLLVAFVLIPALALAAMVQTYRRAMQAPVAQRN